MNDAEEHDDDEFVINAELWSDADEKLFDDIIALCKGNTAHVALGTLCHVIAAVLAGNPDNPTGEDDIRAGFSATVATLAQLTGAYAHRAVGGDPGDPPQPPPEGQSH